MQFRGVKYICTVGLPIFTLPDMLINLLPTGSHWATISLPTAAVPIWWSLQNVRSAPTRGKAVLTLGKFLRFLDKLSVRWAVMVWIKRLCQRLNYAIKSRKQIILGADVNFWKETGLAVVSHIQTEQSEQKRKNDFTNYLPWKKIVPSQTSNFSA